MIQIALVVVSIGLIVLGVKGFTKSGLKFSKGLTLKGTNGKIVGAICVIAGIGLIPLFILIFVGYSALLGG